MNHSPDDVLAHVQRRLREVRAALGLPPLPDGPDLRFGETLDSMGLVEFVGLIADDCGVAPDVIERATGRRFTTLAALASALAAAGLGPAGAAATAPVAAVPPPSRAWLVGSAARLPAHRQPTAELDALLGRPTGWLAEHAGIASRCVWRDEDELAAAAEAARTCVERAGARLTDIGALLVTSEAPPLLAGLAADLHARLGLPAQAVALEIGGACTGFVAALWTARNLLPQFGTVLLLSIEAPTRYLTVRPGPAGEAAALFGDGAGACLLGASPDATASYPLLDIVLGSDGNAGHLLRVRYTPGEVEISMNGPALATRAIRALAHSVEQVAQRQALAPGDLSAIVVHGGNGRLAPLLARELGVPVERVWSETARTGNLGSASLPVAWAAQAAPSGPLAWAAVGAGLTWGAALFGASRAPTSSA